MTHLNAYYDSDYIARKIETGEHRHAIGGMWDEIGLLQSEFVKQQGLTPSMHYLDVGCGCLRGGVHLIGYLDPGHYYGIDLSEDLLQAGYAVELAQNGLTDRQPRENLFATETFEVAQFRQRFDMALAVSVFTHLPLNHLQLCLTQLAPHMNPGGTFFATYYHCPADHDWTKPLRHIPGGKVSFPARDSFHYRPKDLEYATGDLPWRLEAFGPWNHPRDQWMAHFVKIDQ